VKRVHKPKAKLITMIVAATLVIGIGAAIWIGSILMRNKTSEDSVVYNGHGGTFKNTLADFDTPDPSIQYKDGYYYMTFTHNGSDIRVMKSRTLNFREAQYKTVWYPPAETAYSSNIWAPEIQYIQGKWYIYFAADDGDNENHRMYVLQADSDDPLGEYSFKGQIKDDTDKWAIDGLSMEHEGKLYFVWSGWEGDVNIQQNTYIAPMSDPLAVNGPRVLLNEPTLEWEKAGGPPYINEGQSILRKDGRVFIVYSGAGSWTPFYSLGLLALEPGSDPLQTANWHKSERPLLQMDEAAGVYGPGHNTFVASPDGLEEWIVYHATSGISDGWNNRKARAQKVTWKDDGTPDLGPPLSLDTAIEVPSGSGVMKAEQARKAGEEMVFDLVHSTQDSEAPLLIHYQNTSRSEQAIGLSVNGEVAGTVTLPGTSEDRTGYRFTTVKLKAGDNAIALAVDRTDIQIAAIEISRFEAENAQAEGMAETEANPSASGWGEVKLTNVGEASVRFKNVTVPYKGNYILQFAVSNPSDQAAELKIAVDGGKTQAITVPQTDRNKFVSVHLELHLSAGRHEIVLQAGNGNLHVDYLDVRG
jgi:GH43 family beta-xylosidase